MSALSAVDSRQREMSVLATWSELSGLRGIKRHLYYEVIKMSFNTLKDIFDVLFQGKDKRCLQSLPTLRSVHAILHMPPSS